MPGPGQRGGRLDQQCRFADTGIATDKQHRTAHKAAAGHPVEFSDATGQSGGVMRFTGEWFEREHAALAARTAQARGPLGSFLAQSVPFPASFALTLPAAEACTTVLADKREISPGHRGIAPDGRQKV